LVKHMINRYRFPEKLFIFSLTLLTTILCSIGLAFWKTGLGILTSTYLSWILICIIVFILLKYWNNSRIKIRQTENILYKLWLTILLIGLIRGILIIDNYWTAKALIQSTFDLLIPLMAIAFASKSISGRFIRYWLKYATPLFLLSLIIGGAQGVTHFSYSIYLFLSFFISMLPRKWMIFIGLILIYMLSFYITDRAQGLKVVASIIIAIAWKYKDFIFVPFLRVINWIIWICTFSLVILFVTGTYNIFSETSEKEKGKYTTEIKKLDGSTGTEDITSDTRSTIYESVIESAIKNDYVWFGRTPARGNDGNYFGDQISEITGKSERLKNEVCFPNIFTWLGLTGMFAYIFFYFQAFKLALYNSRSKTIKILACFISFHFLLGWMEDLNRWDNNNVLIWMTIGICLSNEFRSMTDNDFKKWIIDCLPKRILGFKL
jgi:hypothetical protein